VLIFLKFNQHANLLECAYFFLVAFFFATVFFLTTFLVEQHPHAMVNSPSSLNYFFLNKNISF